MENIPLGIYILLGIFVLIWIFTRNNIANIILIFPIWALLIYIILNVSDTWIQISCEVGIIGILIISMARTLRRA